MLHICFSSIEGISDGNSTTRPILTNTHAIAPQFFLQDQIAKYTILKNTIEMNAKLSEFQLASESKIGVAEFKQKLAEIDDALPNAYYCIDDLAISLYAFTPEQINATLTVLAEYQVVLNEGGLQTWNQQQIDALKKLKGLHALQAEILSAAPTGIELIKTKQFSVFSLRSERFITECQKYFSKPSLSVKSRISDIGYLLVSKFPRENILTEEEAMELQADTMLFVNKESSKYINFTRIDDILDQMRPDGGVCSGLAFLWGYSRIIEDSAHNEAASESHDPIDVVRKTSPILTAWNGLSLEALSAEQRVEIDRFIENVMHHQHQENEVSSLLYNPDTMTYKLREKFSKIKIFKIDTNAFGKYLDSYLTSGQLIRIRPNNMHDTSIYKSKEGIINFYDPSVGEFIVNDISRFGDSSICNWGRFMKENGIHNYDYKLECELEDMDKHYGLTKHGEDMRMFHITVFGTKDIQT